MTLSKSLISAFFFSMIFSVSAFAQPAPSEEAGGLLRQQIDIERQDVYGRRIQRWPSKDKEAEVQPQKQPEISSASKVMIEHVDVEGAALLTKEEIQKVLSGHFNPGQEMTFSQMQALAEALTALYRQKGYVTSRAYIPPQDLDQGRLLIKVLEGKMGQYEISGHHYFTTRQLEKKLILKPGDDFDYNRLQRSLEYINRHPDRQARVVLLPGQEPGTTDVDLHLLEEAPIDLVLEYDNWASRYLNRDRFAWTLEHNNLTKNDDRLSLKILVSEGDNLEALQGRYVYPLNNTLEVGGYFLTSQSELGRELKSLQAHGEADVLGIFAAQELINTIDFDLKANAGFDFKNVKDYLAGSESSSDKVRMAKIGLEADHDDPWGRSIAGIEADFGIPNILEGMEDQNDPQASRIGAGGEFTKFLLNYFRLQPMPSDVKYLNESYLLWKNLGQYSDDILVSAEQFQIGGATSVRGYAPGEASGDSGLYSALEWSFPFYGLPRDIIVPWTEENLYDSLRFVAFYDWGWVNSENPQAGEEKSRTLRAYGLGVRFNINNDLAARIEVGWPSGGSQSSDGRKAHAWVEFDWRF